MVSILNCNFEIQRQKVYSNQMVFEQQNSDGDIILKYRSVK